MDNIFSLKNILIYLFAINLITFVTMYVDKRKAKWGKWRIKESTLFTLVFLGGGIGGIAGMYLFRHKTKKTRFVIGFPLILITEVICAIILLVK
jgi:uncharacterized membrane protein YsdA (DUF1294 family)